MLLRHLQSYNHCLAGLTFSSFCKRLATQLTATHLKVCKKYTMCGEYLHGLAVSASLMKHLIGFRFQWHSISKYRFSFVLKKRCEPL